MSSYLIADRLPPAGRNDFRLRNLDAARLLVQIVSMDMNSSRKGIVLFILTLDSESM